MPTSNRPVILDVDTGEDDALAILLAVRLGLKLPYVFTSYGNTSLANATQNTAKLLCLAEAYTTPVLPFSQTPLRPHPIEDTTLTTADFVGSDGICNTPLRVDHPLNILSDADPNVAAENALRSLQEVDYIVTGPCTNLARLCLRMGEDIHKHVRRVIIMGGALRSQGNSGPNNIAEFNFYNDPYAAHLVLHSGLPVKLVSWDLTSTITLRYQEIKAFESQHPLGQFVIQLMTNFFEHYGLAHDRTFELNDPLTVLVREGLGTTERVGVEISQDPNDYGACHESEQGAQVEYIQMSPGEKHRATKSILNALMISH